MKKKLETLSKADDASYFAELSKNYPKEITSQKMWEILVDRKLSVESVLNQAYASYRMQLQGGMDKNPVKLHFICGSEEKWALRSYRKLKKYRADVILHVFEGHKHGTKMRLDAQDYVLFVSRLLF